MIGPEKAADRTSLSDGTGWWKCYFHIPNPTIMQRTLHVFFFCGMLSSVLAQPGWTVYDADNGGLGSGAYGGVVLDDAGNVWASGGYVGLSKFNGTTWTHYTQFNSDLPTASISDLEIDATGRIWASHYMGISVLDNGSFTEYNPDNSPLPGEEVYTLDKGPDGRMWIASRTSLGNNDGITIFDGTNWTSPTNYPSQLANANFNDFAFAGGGVVWMATQPAIAKFDGTAFTYYPPITTQLAIADAAAVDADGNVWAGGFDGLLKYNGTWNFQENTSFGFPANTGYYCIFPDGNYLWMGTSQGFIKYNRITGTIAAIYDEDNSPLATNGVLAVAKDATGKLWLATVGAVVKMDPAAVVGIAEEQDQAAELRIFPNPAADQATLITTGLATDSYELRITDLSGRIVRKERMMAAPQITLVLDDLQAGPYHVTVHGAQGVLATERVMVL